MQHKERVSYATTVKQDKQARTVMISATLQDEQDWQDEQDFSNKKIMMKIYEEISGDTGQMAYPIHPASSCPSCFVAEKPLSVHLVSFT